jgi:hypothetical protein
MGETTGKGTSAAKSRYQATASEELTEVRAGMCVCVCVCVWAHVTVNCTPFFIRESNKYDHESKSRL